MNRGVRWGPIRREDEDKGPDAIPQDGSARTRPDAYSQ